MLYLHCPYCGESRDESEFVCAGEAFIERPDDQNNIADSEWADYLFCRENIKGNHFEQWQHAHGCRKLFVVKRNTVTNQIAATGTFANMRTSWLIMRADQAKKTNSKKHKLKPEPIINPGLQDGNRLKAPAATSSSSSQDQAIGFDFNNPTTTDQKPY